MSAFFSFLNRSKSCPAETSFQTAGMFIFLQLYPLRMKDSKGRHRFNGLGKLQYEEYSSLPAENNQNTEESERFFMSFRRKEMTAAKKAYADSARTKPDAPFETARPKGMYFNADSKVVDDYAARRDWRERIQSAVAESESRLHSSSKAPAPWPEAPRNKRNDAVLWEIETKPAAKSSAIVSEEKGPQRIRSKAYETWLAERDTRIKEEEAQLLQSVALKMEKSKRSEAYNHWRAERDVRIAEEAACLTAAVAARRKKQQQAEAYEKWKVEREARIAAEETALAARRQKQKRAEAYQKWMAAREVKIAEEAACLAASVAARQKKQKRAEAYEKWMAARAVKMEEEAACLAANIAARQKKQKRAEAYDKWLAEREARLAEADVCLIKNATARRKKQERAEAYDLWLSERNVKIRAEEAALIELAKAKQAAATVSLTESSFLEAEGEFETVSEACVEEFFKPPVENTVDPVSEEIAEPTDFSQIDTKAEAGNADEAYNNDLQILMGEKKSLELLRLSKSKAAVFLNPDDEFVV